MKKGLSLQDLAKKIEAVKESKKDYVAPSNKLTAEVVEDSGEVEHGKLLDSIVAQTEKMYTLPVALSLYSVGSNGTYYGLLMAGSVLVVTPILILFLFLQRYFVQGIAMTGLK